MKLSLLLLALPAVLVGGCVGLLSPPPEPAPEPRISAEGPRLPSESESLLAYYGFVRKLQPTELAKEHDVVRQLYMASRSDFNRMRYAMLLSIPGTASNDDARALEAIEPMLKNQNAALHDLALMLNAQIQEQRRGQALQQKLDALRLLEKNLLERDVDGTKRK